jgi:hypothetical protein
MNLRRSAVTFVLALCAVLLAHATSSIAQSTADAPRLARILGVWRGTSTCTDRVAAPACNDEVIVYEFTAGSRPGSVRWAADKIVNGQRESMGDPLELSYDESEACWKVELSSPRVRGVWRLSVDGARLTGTAHLLPGNAQVRKVDARKD